MVRPVDRGKSGFRTDQPTATSPGPAHSPIEEEKPVREAVASLEPPPFIRTDMEKDYHFEIEFCQSVLRKEPENLVLMEILRPKLLLSN